MFLNMFNPTYSENEKLNMCNEVIMSDSYKNGIELVEKAKLYIGCPYRWGSNGPKSFDCSGFVQWLFKSFDIHLNRTSREQYLQGEHVQKHELRPGDLVFFSRNNTPQGIYHVGIIIESSPDGQFSFIHSARGGVKISDSRKYDKKYLGSKRIFT